MEFLFVLLYFTVSVQVLGHREESKWTLSSSVLDLEIWFMMTAKDEVRYALSYFAHLYLPHPAVVSE